MLPHNYVFLKRLARKKLRNEVDWLPHNYVFLKQIIGKKKDWVAKELPHNYVFLKLMLNRTTSEAQHISFHTTMYF